MTRKTVKFDRILTNFYTAKAREEETQNDTKHIT